jgi:hypothetical protein
MESVFVAERMCGRSLESEFEDIGGEGSRDARSSE